MIKFKPSVKGAVVREVVVVGEVALLEVVVEAIIREVEGVEAVVDPVIREVVGVVEGIDSVAGLPPESGNIFLGIYFGLAASRLTLESSSSTGEVVADPGEVEVVDAVLGEVAVGVEVAGIESVAVTPAGVV